MLGSGFYVTREEVTLRAKVTIGAIMTPTHPYMSMGPGQNCTGTLLHGGKLLHRGKLLHGGTLLHGVTLTRHIRLGLGIRLRLSVTVKCYG